MKPAARHPVRRAADARIAGSFRRATLLWLIVACSAMFVALQAGTAQAAPGGHGQRLMCGGTPDR